MCIFLNENIILSADIRVLELDSSHCLIFYLISWYFFYYFDRIELFNEEPFTDFLARQQKWGYNSKWFIKKKKAFWNEKVSEEDWSEKDRKEMRIS